MRPEFVPCRVCGKGNEAHTSADNMPRVPHDGDYSLCAYCGAWSIFEGAGFRPPTREELAAIEADPDCAHAERILQAIREKRRQS